MNKIFFSKLLRPQSSNRLLKNFRGFLSLKNKPETLQQDLYHCILAKQLNYFHINFINLGRKSTEAKVDPDLLLPCVRASGVPVKDIKTIEAKRWFRFITTSDWESFHILTKKGAVIQEIETDGADYSPVIKEMIKQGKLLKLRYH